METAASKTDLLRVLKNLPTLPANHDRLVEAEEVAYKALADYEESNAKLCELRKAASKARDARFRLETNARKSRSKKIQDCRNQIYLKGATTATVKMVERLLAAYSGGTEA